MKTTQSFGTLLARLSRGWAGRVDGDADATDRLVSTVVDGAADGVTDRTDAKVDTQAQSDSLQAARLIQAIREIGASDAALPEPGVNAIMAGLRREAETASRPARWRERLGMGAGFLASTATLASGLLLLGANSPLPPLDSGTDSLPLPALTVAALAALIGLFRYRESRPYRKPARGPSSALTILVATALATASCAPDLPLDGPSTIEIPAAALTVFEEGDELWGVRDIIESGDSGSGGVVWALSEAPPFLRAYDHSGRLLADFGTSGEGPGELRNPWTLATDPTGGVIIWDHGNRSRSRFDAAGAFIGSSPAPAVPNGVIRGDIRSVTFGDPFRVAEDDGGLVLASYSQGLTQADDFWSGKILRIATGEAEARTLIDFATDLPGAANRVPLMGLAPVPLWDHCPDGRIVVLDPVARNLHLHAADGTEERRIPVPWQARALSREERLGYVRAMISGETRGTDIADEEVNMAAEGMLAQAGDQLATEAPLGVDLRCGPGWVWIQEFDAASHALGYGRAWRTLSLDDETPPLDGQTPRTRQVLFPAGFIPWRLTDSMAIGVATDDVNLQRVAVVRLGLAIR